MLSDTDSFHHFREEVPLNLPESLESNHCRVPRTHCFCGWDFPPNRVGSKGPAKELYHCPNRDTRDRFPDLPVSPHAFSIGRWLPGGILCCLSVCTSASGTRLPYIRYHPIIQSLLLCVTHLRWWLWGYSYIVRKSHKLCLCIGFHRWSVPDRPVLIRR